MAITHRPGEDELKSIAHDAMLGRGLLPDFSPAVIAETNKIAQAAATSGTAIRDLRDLLWASIDNDDSADLDQLSVAEPMAGGALKILVAIADVDALVKKGSADRRSRVDQHHLGLHRRRNLSNAAGETVHRPHFVGRGSGSAGDRDRNGDCHRRHSCGFRHLPGSSS
jgi:hypothetical protein